ncbi:MAG: metal ABC transporter permease [Eubacteriales bacterium]|nr:metal ABC transporter permease [Eubacteriales bacterium]
MIEFINETLRIFSLAFMQRALIVGCLVSLCASLLGVNMVLKRYSMIGDGLSHVGFGALAVATALRLSPLWVSIPVVVVVAFFLLRLSENSKIKGDAAIALISASSLAIGSVILALSTGMNTDVCNYLFGSIVSMTDADVYLSVALSVIVLLLYVLFYNRIFAVTFDETFAKATGVKANLYNMLLAVLTAVTVVLGMRMMGALMISSLIIFPSLSAMRICKRFGSVVIVSAVLSLGSFLVGMIVSSIAATPTGASVVIVNLIAFLVFWAIGKIKGGNAR